MENHYLMLKRERQPKESPKVNTFRQTLLPKGCELKFAGKLGTEAVCPLLRRSVGF